MYTLADLPFENPYHALPERMFTRVAPDPLHAPRLRHVNTALADRLSIDSTNTDDWAAFINGDEAWGDPIAMKYMGHQFGHFNPDLGDGRGLLMGQYRDANQKLWDFHVKGAGQTPYSRFGDGRAVLRSSIREYCMSAYFKALNIPTTEALALVTSSETALRETEEPTALVVRVADTHVRFGHFEYLGFTQDFDGFDQLLDYTRREHFPETQSVAEWFHAVTQATATMVAHWQALGFCHGVMNTDNMSITGHTFDFGPYALMDWFDPHYICNLTDQGGRYAYHAQPKIALWNCYVLRCAVVARHPELADELDASLRTFQKDLDQHYQTFMQQKLWGHAQHAGKSEDGAALAQSTLQLLSTHRLDYSRFFIGLTLEDWDIALQHIKGSAEANAWVADYQAMGTPNIQVMETINPMAILHNSTLQTVIEAANTDNWQPFEQLITAIQSPFTWNDITRPYAQLPNTSACNGQLSCSS